MSRRHRASKPFVPAIFTRNDSSEIDRLTDGIDAVVSFSAVLDRPRTRFSPFA